MKRLTPGIIIMWVEQAILSNPAESKLPTVNLKSTMTLEYMLSQAMVTHFPVKVVLESKFAKFAAGLLGEKNVIVIPDQQLQPIHTLGYGLATAISECSDVSGWLLLTAQTPFVKSQTLKDLAIALQDHILVYSQYAGQQGYPIGFNAELFSELVRLNSEHELRRLFIRYPSYAVDVEDPGVLTASYTDNAFQKDPNQLNWSLTNAQLVENLRAN